MKPLAQLKANGLNYSPLVARRGFRVKVLCMKRIVDTRYAAGWSRGGGIVSMRRVLLLGPPHVARRCPESLVIYRRHVFTKA
jgi:hypothetical protein